MTNDEIFKIEIQKRFDELMKVKAAIGEIRIWSNGIKYQKQANGSWEPLSKKGVKPEKEEGKFFGKNYFQFKNKPEEAIDFLLKEKRGQVIGALERKELGKIDIVYGNNNGGLCHIRNKHFVHADDFSSLDEMKDIIIDILKSGKIGEPYRDKRDNNLKRNITKGYHKVVVKHTLVYDDEDNFKEKVWVLTSYDVSRKQEDKIRKAVSEETALERDQVIFNPNNSSVSSRKNHLERDQPSVDYSQCSLSQPKDTSYSLNEQQFMDEMIKKAKKGSPIGTEKTWGGKVYIKTDKGWKPKGKGTKKVDEEDSTSKHSSTETLTKQAASATDDQLKAAINDPEANSELKKVAQEELNKRNKQQDSDDKSNKQFTVEDAYKNLLEAQEKGELELGQDVLDKIQEKLEESKKKKENKEDTVDNKLDKLKQEITSEIDKKLSDMTGFKKITQTYVKKDGKTVVIKMKGDNQYKATSPGFKLESKPYESLTDFKKRIKEELDKQSTKTEKKGVEEKQELSFAEGKEFETITQFYKWNEERSQLSNLYNEEDVKKMESEANEYLSKGNLDLSLKSSIYSAIDEYNFNEVLKEYGSRNDEEKKQVNAILIAQGYAPIASGLDYHNYKGEDYLYINPRNSSDNDREYMKIYKEDANEITSKWTDNQRKAICSYTSSGYLAIRDILTESPEVKKWSEEKIELTKNRINHIKEFIEQNPLRRNMVLNRRLKISKTGNNLSTWLNAKVGQVIEDKSFASFAMRHEDYFGSDLQITLLAKKGDSIVNVDNAVESEYLVQAGSKYKVLARGTNSIVVEII